MTTTSNSGWKKESSLNNYWFLYLRAKEMPLPNSQKNLSHILLIAWYTIYFQKISLKNHNCSLPWEKKCLIYFPMFFTFNKPSTLPSLILCLMSNLGQIFVWTLNLHFLNYSLTDNIYSFLISLKLSDPSIISLFPDQSSFPNLCFFSRASIISSSSRVASWMRRSASVPANY